MKSPFDDLVPPARWPELGLRTFLAIGILVLLLLPVACPARGVRAQLFTPEQCRHFADFALAGAEARDIGADVEKHLALLRRRIAGVTLWPLFERELRRVYAEGLEPEKAEESAHTRCMTGEILRREG